MEIACSPASQATPYLIDFDPEKGKPIFKHLLHRHGEPIYFYAFDLIWLDGEDFRQLALTERKELLRGIVPAEPSYLLYLDHLVEKGVELFQSVCEMDLEGIVAKWREGPYSVDKKTSWIKIKNPDYSQASEEGSCSVNIR